MADDDLDYHVCFPTPEPTGEEGFFNDHAVVQDESHTPVVILLGWTGSDDYHLGNYSSVYEKKGYTTIRYTTPAKDMMLQPELLRKKAIKILELMFDLNLEDNPLFFHVFGNGGGQLYNCIVELLLTRKEHRMLQVHGTVFDSCPAKNQLRVAGQVLTEFNEISFFKSFFTLIFTVYVTFCFVFRWVFSRGRTWNTRLWGSIKAHQSRWPQMFLYSKKDDLVNYLDIEELITYRESLGVDIRSVCWDDSSHVCHLETHKEVYTQQCLTFIDDCTPKFQQM